MIKSKKIIKKLYFTLAVLMILGMIFGPIAWINSHVFFEDYESFKQGSKTIEGTVISKRSESGYRLQSYYVKIKFYDQDEYLSSEIKIQAPLYDYLYDKQSLELLYNKNMIDLVKMKMETKPQFTPILLTKGLGKWITIVSYALIILQIIFKHKINSYLDLKRTYILINSKTN